MTILCYICSMVLW